MSTTHISGRDSAGLARALAGLAGLVRLVPFGFLRLPNFAPVGGLGLFAGARLPLWQAVSLPFAVMLVTDWLLQTFYDLPGFDPFAYASFGVYVLLGRLFLRDTESPTRIAAVSLLASAQFFLVTNFGAWYADRFNMYPDDLGGLWLAYVLGLPFALGTFAGDLTFGGLMFAADAVYRRSTAPAVETAEES